MNSININQKVVVINLATVNPSPRKHGGYLLFYNAVTPLPFVHFFVYPPTWDIQGDNPPPQV